VFLHESLYNADSYEIYFKTQFIKKGGKINKIKIHTVEEDKTNKSAEKI
jgi:hypothetical protein